MSTEDKNALAVKEVSGSCSAEKKELKQSAACSAAAPEVKVEAKSAEVKAKGCCGG
jgi:hypothetical protein